MIGEFSGEMIIYAFLLRYFSPYNQTNVTSKSRSFVLGSKSLEQLANHEHKLV